MSRVKGGGYKGYELILACVPDATLKTQLDAWVLADTAVTGKLVHFTFLNAYEVAMPADGETVCGEIVNWIYSGGVSDRSYVLSVRVWAFDDQNAAIRPATKIVNAAYSGTFALQDSIVANSSTAISVKDGGTGGYGACIAKDVPATGYADIIM